MKEEFVEYLGTIGIEGELLARIEEIVKQYELILDEPVLEIFISEYQNAEKQREYEGLWLFTENLVMESKNFVSKDDFDFALLKNNVNYINFIKKDYNLEEANANSRFTINSEVFDDIKIYIKSSGSNCDKLLALSKKYILPNLGDL